MGDILDEIIINKRQEIELAKRLKTLAELQEDIKLAPPARNFFSALSPRDKPRIIAECKKQSPSRGIMIKEYNPVTLAKAYEQGGAAAISVLTDHEFFGGTLEDLTAVKQAVTVPVLRKDFIIDEYQIFETRAAGADAFLLLSGVLAPRTLEHFIFLGRSMGMEPLVESHSAIEFDDALTTSGRILGVNSRNLKDFSVDLDRAKTIYERGFGVSSNSQEKVEKILVCESGIKEPKDVRQMRSVGYNVFLIGEALVTGSDPEKSVAAMISGG